MALGSVDLRSGIRLWTDRGVSNSKALACHNATDEIALQRELLSEIHTLTKRLAFLQSWRERYRAQGDLVLGRG